MSMSGTGEHCAVRIIRLLWALRVGTKCAAAIIVVVVGAAIVKSSLVIAEPLLLGLLCPLHDVFHSEAHLDQPLQLLIQEALLHLVTVHHKVWDYRGWIGRQTVCMKGEGGGRREEHEKREKKMYG